MGDGYIDENSKNIERFSNPNTILRNNYHPENKYHKCDQSIIIYDFSMSSSNKMWHIEYFINFIKIIYAYIVTQNHHFYEKCNK